MNGSAGALVLVGLLSRIARASDEVVAEEERYAHPLILSGLTELVPDTLTVAEARQRLHDTVVYDEGIHDESGTYVVRSVARLAEREPTDIDAALERTPAPEGPVIDARLSSVIASPEAWSSDTLDVWLTFEVGSTDPVPALVSLDILRGLVRTDDEAWAARQAAIAYRREAARITLDSLVADLEGLGGIILEQIPEAGLVRVDAPPTLLTEIVGWPALRAAEFAPGPDEPDAGGDGAGWDVYGLDIDGYELTDLLQLDQFYTDGFYGRPTERITSADSIGDNVRRGHPGFDDVWGVDRFANCTGTGPTCASNPNPSVGSNHATDVASLLLGDVTAGQDFLCSPVLHNCEEKSGVARESLGYGVKSDESWSHIQSIATTHSYVMSQTSTYVENPGDPECSGATSRTRAWNSMYEDGVAIFISNGNEEHSAATPWDCTVNEPATAMGVFTISAYTTNPAASPPEAPTIQSSTSRGGTPNQGVRTLYGAAAPSNIIYHYSHDESSPNQYGGSPFGGSSAAAPVAAGAAAVFRDWYRASVSTLIDDPGILYTAMLLMGDRRYNDTGSRLTAGYNNLWGAGVLRLRKLDAEGLDAPATWAIGSVCVDNGQSAVSITSNTLSPDVDYAKAVAWWYDPTHDNAGQGHGNFDRVKMDLQKDAVPGLGAWTTVATTSLSDNKLRIYYTGAGGLQLRLRFTGTDVKQDTGGCGTNSVRVFWAWLLEENDRDDDPYLSTHIRPE